jgi:CxxC motif-containing protein (DUF1111 family)
VAQAVTAKGASDPGPRPGAAGAGAPATPQPINFDNAQNQAEASVACFPGLSSTVLQFCEQAVIRFQEVDSVSGTVGTETGVGLGPTYNANACSACHSQPAVLGAGVAPSSPQFPGTPNPQVALATLDGARNTVPSFITASGPIREARFKSDNGVHDLYTIADRSDAPGCNATQPDFATNLANNNVSFRIPISTFGDGLVENVSEAQLQQNLAQSSAKFNTGGTFNISGNDGTITRFGWKAQNKSLLVFSTEAYNVEQGVTNLGFPNERSGGANNLQGCLAFNPTPEDNTNISGNGANTVSDVSADAINFAAAMQLSKPPTPAATPFTIGNVTITANQVTQGRNQFINVGCGNCHTPTLTAAASSFDPALSNVQFHPFSDFAIHHMGSGLADGITQGNAGGDQFRSAPLWGVGQRLFFLHDGRTSDLTAAIAAHGGDASTVINNFNNLSESDQQDVIYFLRSL